jgi:hypothetical protein
LFPPAPVEPLGRVSRSKLEEIRYKIVGTNHAKPSDTSQFENCSRLGSSLENNAEIDKNHLCDERYM